VEGARIRDLATLYKASISLVVLHIWLISTIVYKTIVFIIETVINIHKHTLSRDAVKAFKLIKDPDAFQLLGDETRRRIIYLLRAKEMTVSQIAGELNLTPQAIYHHIRKLRDAGMVEVAREERVDHYIETYYRATAEIFNMSHGSGTSSAYHEEKAAESLKALSRIGLTVRDDPTLASRLVELEKRMDQIGEKQSWADAIAGLEDVDFFVKQGVDHLAKLLMMSDKEFNEYLNLIREERKLLRSLKEAPEKVEVVARKA
jgi:DNA-binding transcriptional ArsR family regulator